MRSLRRGPQHKRRCLLFLFLKLSRVEENFSVSVSVDYVANLLDIEPYWANNAYALALCCVVELLLPGLGLGSWSGH